VLAAIAAAGRSVRMISCSPTTLSRSPRRCFRQPDGLLLDKAMNFDRIAPLLSMIRTRSQ